MTIPNRMSVEFSNRTDSLAKVGITRNPIQLTQADLTHLTAAEINRAREQGQLFDLMGDGPETPGAE
jgi:hypothetical protein